MTTFNILKADEIRTRTGVLRSTAATLQVEIHVLAVSCLAHIRDHGDWTLFTGLLDAIPKGQRVQALVLWSSVFSGKLVSFSAKPGEGYVGKLARGWETKKYLFDIEGAFATTFADLVPERGYSTLTIGAALAYIKRKANDTGLHPDGSPKVDPKAREFLGTLFARGTELLIPKAEANV
jgi:hypothetical protein